jgi:hypothetical protein
MLTKSQVKVKKFNQARVNGGSNYDSIKRVRYRESAIPVSSAHDTIKLRGLPKASTTKQYAKAYCG